MNALQKESQRGIINDKLARLAKAITGQEAEVSRARSNGDTGRLATAQRLLNDMLADQERLRGALAALN